MLFIALIASLSAVPGLTTNIDATNVAQVFTVEIGTAPTTAPVPVSLRWGTDGAAAGTTVCSIAVGEVSCKFGFAEVATFLASTGSGTITLHDGTGAVSGFPTSLTDITPVLSRGSAANTFVFTSGTTKTTKIVTLIGSTYTQVTWTSDAITVAKVDLKTKIYTFVYSVNTAVTAIEVITVPASVRSAGRRESASDKFAQIVDTLGTGLLAGPTHVDFSGITPAIAKTAVTLKAADTTQNIYETATIASLPAAFRIQPCSAEATCDGEIYTFGNLPTLVFTASNLGNTPFEITNAGGKAWSLQWATPGTAGAKTEVCSATPPCKFDFAKIETFLATAGTGAVTFVDTATTPNTLPFPTLTTLAAPTLSVATTPAGNVNITAAAGTTGSVYVKVGTAHVLKTWAFNSIDLAKADVAAKTILYKSNAEGTTITGVSIVPIAASARKAERIATGPKAQLVDSLGSGIAAAPGFVKITADGYTTVVKPLSATANITDKFGYETEAITDLPASYKLKVCTGATVDLCTATEEYEYKAASDSAFSVVASLLLLVLAFAL